MMRQGLRLAQGLFRNGSKIMMQHAAVQPQANLLYWRAYQPARVRAFTMSSWPFSQPRDYSLPNESWSPEMLRLYHHYNALCEAKEDEGKKGWRRIPSYNRSLKFAPGGKYLSKLLQSDARLFTRNIKEPGFGFEYVLFLHEEENRCVCVFQAGNFLEGPPGHVHGGATATMIDSVTGTLATYLSGPVLTANLNINYRSPIPLGSVVLVHCALERTEGRKTFLSCRVTSSDEAKLHSDATGLFVSISVGHLFGS